MPKIDLNCDMGESWHDEIVGRDAEIMPLITSCNLGCGVHGGDPETMRTTIILARRYGVKIGAHPSLPGRHNFGREPVDLPESALYDLLTSQVQALQEAAISLQASVEHLKPHGALYHLAAREEKEAAVVVRVCRERKISRLYGPPGSRLETLATAAGVDFIPEGFIDRVYENGEALRSRKLPDAIIRSPERAAAQALQMAERQTVTDHHGRTHPLRVRTLCIHGDHPEALDNLLAVRAALRTKGIETA